jgi:hypothetical protein
MTIRPYQIGTDNHTMSSELFRVREAFKLAQNGQWHAPTSGWTAHDVIVREVSARIRRLGAHPTNHLETWAIY